MKKTRTKVSKLVAKPRQSKGLMEISTSFHYKGLSDICGCPELWSPVTCYAVEPTRKPLEDVFQCGLCGATWTARDEWGTQDGAPYRVL